MSYLMNDWTAVFVEQPLATPIMLTILQRRSGVLLLLLILLQDLCHAQGTPLDSEMEWTGEFWSKALVFKYHRII